MSKLKDLAFLPIFIVTNLLVLPVAIWQDWRDQRRG